VRNEEFEVWSTVAPSDCFLVVRLRRGNLRFALGVTGGRLGGVWSSALAVPGSAMVEDDEGKVFLRENENLLTLFFSIIAPENVLVVVDYYYRY
jgi:hypothetical protein